MELLPEWREFLGVLKRHGVRFLLVGAHALAAHGRPRFTQDLDVLVDPTPANARRVAAAIAEFGFKETARDWRWFAKPYRITMIGRIARHGAIGPPYRRLLAKSPCSASPSCTQTSRPVEAEGRG